jgi:hypothetical protein
MEAMMAMACAAADDFGDSASDNGSSSAYGSKPRRVLELDPYMRRWFWTTKHFDHGSSDYDFDDARSTPQSRPGSAAPMDIPLGANQAAGGGSVSFDGNDEYGSEYASEYGSAKGGQRQHGSVSVGEQSTVASFDDAKNPAFGLDPHVVRSVEMAYNQFVDAQDLGQLPIVGHESHFGKIQTNTLLNKVREYGLESQNTNMLRKIMNMGIVFTKDLEGDSSRRCYIRYDDTAEPGMESFISFRRWNKDEEQKWGPVEWVAPQNMGKCPVKRQSIGRTLYVRSVECKVDGIVVLSDDSRFKNISNPDSAFLSLDAIFTLYREGSTREEEKE